jgi:hypothetical protein
VDAAEEGLEPGGLAEKLGAIDDSGTEFQLALCGLIKGFVHRQFVIGANYDKRNEPSRLGPESVTSQPRSG